MPCIQGITDVGAQSSGCIAKIRQKIRALIVRHMAVYLCLLSTTVQKTWTVTFLKVHMHEIFIVCFEIFFGIFQSLIYTKRSTANIFENILKIHTDIQSF